MLVNLLVRQFKKPYFCAHILAHSDENFRTDTNPLNSVITIKIERNDFLEEKVSKILNDYRKKLISLVFRKGHVPIGMIKNQYETAVTAEEVNKLLQENLEKYLNEEKINILGNPLPVAMEDDIDWKSSELSFAFELGLAPKFDLNLSEKIRLFSTISPQVKV